MFVSTSNTTSIQHFARRISQRRSHEIFTDKYAMVKMETQKPPLKLLVHADGVLPQPVQPHLIACCPTMDLIAFVNQDEQLNVYRFGGQRAFGLQKRNGTGNIVSLGWKFNGKGALSYSVLISASTCGH